jgi:hypothetical protein
MQRPDVPLAIADWETVRVDADFYAKFLPHILERYSELAGKYHCRRHARFMISEEAGLAAGQLRQAGVTVTALPPLGTVAEMGSVASGAVGRGEVKLCRSALEKARAHHLGSALDFGAGRGEDDAVARAVLAAVIAGQDEDAARRRQRMSRAA